MACPRWVVVDEDPLLLVMELNSPRKLTLRDFAPSPADVIFARMTLLMGMIVLSDGKLAKTWDGVRVGNGLDRNRLVHVNPSDEYCKSTMVLPDVPTVSRYKSTPFAVVACGVK